MRPFASEALPVFRVSVVVSFVTTFPQKFFDGSIAIACIT